METLTTIVSFLLLLGLVLVPIILFTVIKKRCNLKFEFLIYLLAALALSAGIMFVFSWWDYKTTEILLKQYNALIFNEDFATYQYSIENVKPDNLKKVEQLRIEHLGVGWPLKAITSFLFYSPYLLLVYGAGQLVTRLKVKKHDKQNNNPN